MRVETVGSICSGIEAASVAWEPLGFDFKWFSEIADFPSRVLAEKYPEVVNLGDMTLIPERIRNGEVDAPDLLCGGTPCQAFSYAGWQNGLNDDRGNLTLKFVDIVESNDNRRIELGKNRSIVFWENVEGVLSDKTNAFGCLVSSLAGLKTVLEKSKWPTAGAIHGPLRNVAWRVLDAKYFGVPQQRRRLYLMAGGTDFYPELVLFEIHKNQLREFPKTELSFEKDGHRFEVFREYTDCLYSAYGTKWNGNAAAFNGSLFVVQDDRIRRISPLETERLMGFPDNYTDLQGAKKTNRYQATGNSWAVPVVRWLGQQLQNYTGQEFVLNQKELVLTSSIEKIDDDGHFCANFGKGIVEIGNAISINCSAIPENCTFGSMKDIVSCDAPEDIYISPVGCQGIVRRKEERKAKINSRLEIVLRRISSQMDSEEIERRSRVQKRGRLSKPADDSGQDLSLKDGQMSIFDLQYV